MEIRSTPNKGSVGWSLIASYWIAAYRHFKRKKLTTALNLLGLTLGLSCFIFICLYVSNEYSFDNYFKDAERIYRVTFSWRSQADTDGLDIGMSLASVPEQLRTSCPEIEVATGIAKLRHGAIVRIGSTAFQEENFAETDTSFFQLFPSQIVTGNLRRVGPQSIVLTESLAKKYFGSQDALKQVVTVNENAYDVIAVIKDIPVNSSLRYAALMFTLDQYSTDWCFTYFKMLPNSRMENIRDRINEFFVSENSQHLQETQSTGVYQIEKLTDIHFGPVKLFDAPKGNELALFVFMTIALLILIISCINYVNLNLAAVAGRQVEAGIRKVFGAGSGLVRTQYIFEFFLLLCICTVISVLLIASFWPMLQKQGFLRIELQSESLLKTAAGILVVLFILSVIGGSYVSSQLTGATPIDNLKQRIGTKRNSLFLNFLLIIQFTSSIALIFSARVVMQQMDLLAGRADKMNLNQVMVIEVPKDETMQSAMKQFRRRLNQLPYVRNSSFTGYHSLPTMEPDYEVFGLEVNQVERVRTSAYALVDEDFFSTLNIPLVAGRNFNAQDVYGDSSWNSPIVNEAFVRSQGWTDDPLRHRISYDGIKANEATIVGVVRDFNFQGFHKKIEPMIFYPNTNRPEKLMVRLSSANSEKIDDIKKLWATEINLPFEFRFLDDYFLEVVKNEKNLQRLLIFFSTLSVVIACLGLFGVVNINLEQRHRETAIRQVFGAKVPDLLLLTWKPYVLFFLFSSILAYPTAAFVLDQWLENFPVKTQLSAYTYFGAIGVIILVLIVMVIYHATNISKSQLMKWMRYE